MPNAWSTTLLTNQITMTSEGVAVCADNDGNFQEFSSVAASTYYVSPSANAFYSAVGFGSDGSGESRQCSCSCVVMFALRAGVGGGMNGYVYKLSANGVLQWVYANLNGNNVLGGIMVDTNNVSSIRHVMTGVDVHFSVCLRAFTMVWMVLGMASPVCPPLVCCCGTTR